VDELTKELAIIMIADETDDVDCSVSTMVFRNRRYGELVDAGADEYAASAFVEGVLRQTRFYASGVPYQHQPLPSA
jgi:hypothetical protein